MMKYNFVLYRTGELSEQKKDLINYKKLLFGMVSTLCVMLLFIMQSYLSQEGVPPSLYVAAVSVTLLQATFVSDSNVQKFIQNSLEHKLTRFREQWKRLLTFCDSRSNRVLPVN
jgi:hypothetical protein